MKVTTEERAIEFIKSKGGKVNKIIKEKDKQYFYITCKHGHHFRKEKRKLLYQNQYCIYYPCNAGVSSEWSDKQGFKIFKSRLKEIFGNDVVCIEKTPLESKEFLFKCNKCGNEWTNRPSYQLTSKPNRKKPPSCEKCGGSEATSTEEKRKYLSQFNIKVIDGLASIKNQQTFFHYQCKKCSSKGFKTLNNLIELHKNNLGYCDCSYVRVHWTVDKLKKAGKESGYRLMGSPKVIDTSTLYKWKCTKKGHTTKFAIGSLKDGCNTCYLEGRFTNLKNIKDFLKDNAPKIKLIPKQTWTGSHSSYEFRCLECNQPFSKHIHNLIKYPICKTSANRYSEIVVKLYLEKLLKINFKANLKYSFLKNTKSNKMELDGYNERLKIAFEHHGIQHYKEGSYHNEKNTLKQRIIDDELKRKQCSAAGVKLIEIPALFDITPIEDLKNVIKKELIRLKIKIPKDFDKTHVYRSELNICLNKNSLSIKTVL
jgi:hypothetical protein